MPLDGTEQTLAKRSFEAVKRPKLTPNQTKGQRGFSASQTQRRAKQARSLDGLLGANLDFLKPSSRLSKSKRILRQQSEFRQLPTAVRQPRPRDSFFGRLLPRLQNLPDNAIRCFFLLLLRAEAHQCMKRDFVFGVFGTSNLMNSMAEAPHPAAAIGLREHPVGALPIGSVRPSLSPATLYISLQCRGLRREKQKPWQWVGKFSVGPS
ncbi:hypothetical protein ACLOJK_009875 [Asimina triloba]